MNEIGMIRRAAGFREWVWWFFSFTLDLVFGLIAWYVALAATPTPDITCPLARTSLSLPSLPPFSRLYRYPTYPPACASARILLSSRLSNQSNFRGSFRSFFCRYQTTSHSELSLKGLVARFKHIYLSAHPLWYPLMIHIRL